MEKQYISDYDVRLATLAKMGGDASKNYASVYDIDIEILKLTGQGGGTTPEEVRAIVEEYNYTTMADVEAKDYMNQKKLTLNGDATAIVDEDGNVLTYTQVKALVDNKALFVYLLVDNAFYIPCGDMVIPSGHNAVEFSSAFIVNDTPNLARIIIDTENEVIYEQYILADRDWVEEKIAEIPTGDREVELVKDGYITADDYAGIMDFSIKPYTMNSTYGKMYGTVNTSKGQVHFNWISAKNSYTQLSTTIAYFTFTWSGGQYQCKWNSKLSATYDPLTKDQFATINGQSIVDGGDIEIKGGGSQIISYDGLMFTAEENNSTIQLTQVGTSTLDYDFETSTDGEHWSTYTIGDVITLAKTGDKVCWRGNNTQLGESTSVYKQFVMSGKIAASGNISSIVKSLNYNKSYTMARLFENCASLTSAPQFDDLYTSTGSAFAFLSMFKNCTELVKGPSTLFKPYYHSGTTIYKPLFGSYACSEMFSGCTKLTSVPDIYINRGSSISYSSLSEYCFHYMFTGCTSLETPAKFIYNKSAKDGGCVDGANSAMYRMYSGCTKLTTTPELFFVGFGYGYLFSNCFSGCTNLKTIITNFVTTGTPGNHFNDWVTNVGTGGVFYDLANYNGLPSSSTSGIPSGWTVKYAYDNDIDDNHSTSLTTYSSSKIDTTFAKIVSLTQAEYDALETKDEHTLYIITDQE